MVRSNYIAELVSFGSGEILKREGKNSYRPRVSSPSCPLLAHPVYVYYIYMIYTRRVVRFGEH